MKTTFLLLPLLALAASARARTEDPATNAPVAFRATILGDRPAGPYLVSNRVARLRDTFGLSSPSGLRSAFDARSAPEGAVAERSFREEADGTVSIRRERFLVPFSELPAERAFSDGFRVRLEPADGPAAPPPAEEDVSVFDEWHASLTGPAEPPPEGVSPAVFLARRQMNPFGPPDEFEFSLGYRNHPALPEGTNIVWAGWLRSEQKTESIDPSWPWAGCLPPEQKAGFIEQSWPVRMNGQRLEISHSVFWDGYRGGDLFLFEIRSLPLGRLPEEVPMTGCLLAISTDGSLPAVLYSDFPEEFRKTTAVADDPAVVRELLKDIEDIQRSGSDETHAESVSTDSPLASALASGDWFPLVVESVSIDTTAPRELRKNWVVSFASGIKARIHSPVKTFGVSADELSGKRFNVRFADCAAATNALHGTVYAGELEVHPSQNPEIPATNTPAASEAPVPLEWERIVCDAVRVADEDKSEGWSDYEEFVPPATNAPAVDGAKEPAP